MFINRIHKKKGIISLSLLLAFGVVFGCDLLCDLEVIDLSLGHHSHSSDKTAHHHSESDHHNHGNSDHHSYGDSHHDDLESENSTSETDECCEEETNKLYASLIKHEAADFQLGEIPVSLGFTSTPPITYTFVYYKKHNPNALKSALSPPIPGREIRVSHQSFLC